MSTPFEQFTIRQSYWMYGKYVLEVWPCIINDSSFKEQGVQRREKQLRFIEEAIYEKLARESK